MPKTLFNRIFMICSLSLTFAVSAEEKTTDSKLKFEKILSEMAPAEFTISKISSTPLDNIKEVVIESKAGSQIYYMSEDGAFLFDGNLLSTLEKQNLTEGTRAEIRKTYLDNITDGMRINFFPENMQHTITVFTDTDCGYCRKLHSQMDEYHALGIGISYVFFPRAGMNSPSFDTAVNIWCAEDQKIAMDQSQMGKTLQQISCDNPVKQHLDTAIKSGLAQMGTPSIVTSNGQLIRGYLPPKTLKQRLDMLQ